MGSIGYANPSLVVEEHGDAASNDRVCEDVIGRPVHAFRAGTVQHDDRGMNAVLVRLQQHAAQDGAITTGEFDRLGWCPEDDVSQVVEQYECADDGDQRTETFQYSSCPAPHLQSPEQAAWSRCYKY